MAAHREREDKKSKKVWLHAWHDPVAGIKAFTPCVRLADLNGDGDSKLLVGTADKRLKIYKGTNLLSENVLLDAPVAICTFNSDGKKGSSPSVAVGAGAYVFIYRNLRPYYKFTLPLLEVSTREVALWEELTSQRRSIDEAREELANMRDGGNAISSRSQDLLGIDDPQEATSFINDVKEKPLVRQTVVTCMEVLRKDMDEEGSISMLVVGTEAGQVHILEPSGTRANVSVQLPATPAFMAVTGLYTVEYRIVCACRDGHVYSIKNGEQTGAAIELEAMPCGLVRIDKTILVACMSSVVNAFHIKGKKLYSLFLPAPAVCIEQLELQKRAARALLLGLANGELRCYQEKHLIATLQLGETLTGLRFGPYGREESSLICIGESGSITIKMLQRQADLDSAANPVGPPPEQDVPLSIPKKTKLYVEQTQREREQAIDMHRIFQRDLCKLRLSTARSYVKIITDGQGPVSYTSGSSLRLTAQVQGLGPAFKVKLSLQNTGRKVVTDMVATLTYNAMLYRLKQSLFKIPLLVPGVMLRLDAELECVDENGGADTIRVFVCSAKSSMPILSAVVNMPMSEMLLNG